MDSMGLTSEDLPTLRAVVPDEPYHHFAFDKPIDQINYDRLINFAFGVTSGGATTIKNNAPFMPSQ